MGKKVFRGWVPKNTKEVLKYSSNGILCLREEVYDVKGIQNEFYFDDDWPPKKVTITVEVED